MQTWLASTLLWVGAALAAFNGFVGAAVIFGDPPHRQAWLLEVVLGIALGACLAAIGAHQRNIARWEARHGTSWKASRRTAGH